jgi:hypothetical protein
MKRRERKIRGRSSDRSTTVSQGEEGWTRKAIRSKETEPPLATASHDLRQAAEAAPEAMRFVQNDSLRGIVEDALRICERLGQRNRVNDVVRRLSGLDFNRV